MGTFSNIETIPFYGNAGLELCLRTTPKEIPLEQVPDPFVHITRVDPVARWFAGVFRTDLGQALFPVSVRILRDTIGQEEGGSVSNADIEQLWEQEHGLSGAMAEYRGSSFSFSSFETESGRIKKNFPLLFCKRKRLFFSPVCPYCGKRLTECREDDLLGEVSLKQFSNSLRRYLYCSDCSPEGRYRPAFFAKELEEPEKDNPFVTDRFGLMSLWAKVHTLDNAGGLFPCAGCESYKGCFPEGQKLGDAVRLLYPFSFYNFFASVRKYAPYSLEHAFDLIGGMPVEELAESMQNARDEVGIRACRELLSLAKSRSFYFSSVGDSIKISASEIFALKLNLYCQALRLIASAWNVTRAPLTVIFPGNFAVSLADDNPGVPIFWEMKTEPSYITSVLYDHLKRDVSKKPEQLQSVEPVGEGIFSTPLFSVGSEFMRIDPAKAGKRIHGNLLINRCELIDSDNKVKVEGTIRFSGSRSLFEESGFLKVDLGFEQGFSRNLDIVFRIDNVSAGKAEVVSLPLQVTVEEIQQFQILASQPPFEISFHFLPNFTIEADLYSAGVLGLRLFLCNKKVSLSDILNWIDSKKTEIVEAMADSNNEHGWVEVLHEDAEGSELFNAANVCYDGNSAENITQDIAKELWDKFICCLLNMIFSSRGKGYSVAKDAGGIDVWNTVIQDIENIRIRVRGRETADLEKSTPVGERKAEERKKSEIGKILQVLLSDLSWLEPEIDKVSKDVERPVPPPPVEKVTVKEKKEPVPEAREFDAEAPPMDETMAVGVSRKPREAIVPPPVPEPEARPEPEKQFPGIDDLDKTVVLPSSLKRKKRKVPVAPEIAEVGGRVESAEVSDAAEKKAKEEVFLDETIVIRKKPKKK